MWYNQNYFHKYPKNNDNLHFVHRKYCINSESRFDFLKELVSGVPDLQGDMDINLDAIPTGSTGSELTTPPMITPVPSTTSSIAWPSEYSGLSSHTLPSNSTAIVTSPHNSPVAEASVSMVSQHYSKSSFKNNLNRNNNTSRSTGSYLKEETNPNALKDTNVPESKESLHTKGIRKRYVVLIVLHCNLQISVELSIFIDVVG